jgi:hypothetical protein
VSHPQLIFGWSALLAILLMPMSDPLRFGALGLLVVALGFVDAIRMVVAEKNRED